MRRPTQPVVLRDELEARRRDALRRWDRGAAVAIALLALLGAAPFAAWWLTPRRDPRVLVVDKTVPHPGWREHLALMWWLGHRRLVPADDGRWDPARDYLGHDPATRRGAALDSAALAGRRLVYLADAYGVYAGDYAAGRASPPGRGAAAALEHSALLYGGISLAEAEALAAFQRRGGAVVAEFNTLETPTWGTAASPVLGRVLGARYEGWLGRWYADLASEDEIPPWMRERWRRRTGRPWEWAGPGLVLFGEADGRLVVLPAARFADGAPVTLEIDRPDDPLVRGARSGTPYWYWFAGVAPTAEGVTLASFALHLDAAGDSLLRAEGFPRRFPALVRRRAAPLGAYLAGDFADVGARPPRLQRTRLLDPLRRRIARGAAPPGSADDVFWNFTTRVWDGALAESGAAPR